jgi:hypothetical protein
VKFPVQYYLFYKRNGIKLQNQLIPSFFRIYQGENGSPRACPWYSAKADKFAIANDPWSKSKVGAISQRLLNAYRLRLIAFNH